MKRERALLVRRTEGIAALLIFLLGTSMAQSQSPLRSLSILTRRRYGGSSEDPGRKGERVDGEKTLGQEEGMFFIFETEDYHAFWMKDTLIPLSIARR